MHFSFTSLVQICETCSPSSMDKDAAGSFCIRAAGVTTVEPVARRDRIVVSTLRCGRSNPGSNPGHGIPMLLSNTFCHLILQLDFFLKLGLC